MRWSVIKKIWTLAKAAFPKERLFPDVPLSFAKEGKIGLVDPKTGKKEAEISYFTTPDKMILRLKDFQEEVPLPKRNTLSFLTNAIKTDEFVQTQKLGKLLSQNYQNEGLLSIAAKIYEGKGETKSFEQWLEENEFPEKILRIAAKKTHDRYQRVRIRNPLSMEHNEMGVILDVVGDKNKNFKYLVLVDGSSKPQWFDQNSISTNLAGVIIDE